MEEHLKEKEVLDHSLPSSIIIGPFLVSVENVRQTLSKKRRALANAVLDRLALKLGKHVEDVSNAGFCKQTLMQGCLCVWVCVPLCVCVSVCFAL